MATDQTAVEKAKQDAKDREMADRERQMQAAKAQNEKDAKAKAEVGGDTDPNDPNRPAPKKGESGVEENLALGTGNAPGLKTTEYVTAQDLAGNRVSEYKTVTPEVSDPADRSEVIAALKAERKLAEETLDANAARKVDEQLRYEGEKVDGFCSPDELAEKKTRRDAARESGQYNSVAEADKAAEKDNGKDGK